MDHKQGMEKFPTQRGANVLSNLLKFLNQKKKKKVIAMTVKQLLFNVSFSPFIKVLVTFFFFFLVTEK